MAKGIELGIGEQICEAFVVRFPDFVYPRLYWSERAAEAMTAEFPGGRGAEVLKVVVVRPMGEQGRSVSPA